jgi:membrane protein YdbS with pleckstrin-like domain
VNNVNDYFYPIPGSKDEEKIVIFARRHWVAYIGQLLIGFVLLVIPIVIFILVKTGGLNFSGSVASNFIVIGASIYYLIAISFIFATWITFYYDLYILTHEEIVDIDQQGFFGRSVSQLSLMRVQDVNSHVEGFLQTLFGFGDVIIETAGERSETFHLKSIPNPQAFSAKVLEMHDILIANSGRKDQLANGEGTIKPQQSPQTPTPQAPKPPPTPAPQTPQAPPINKPDVASENQGEVSKDDLNKGGEVKF